jgi:hypothetical protein
MVKRNDDLPEVEGYYIDEHGNYRDNETHKIWQPPGGTNSASAGDPGPAEDHVPSGARRPRQQRQQGFIDRNFTTVLYGACGAVAVVVGAVFLHGMGFFRGGHQAMSPEMAMSSMPPTQQGLQRMPMSRIRYPQMAMPPVQPMAPPPQQVPMAPQPQQVPMESVPMDQMPPQPAAGQYPEPVGPMAPAPLASTSQQDAALADRVAALTTQVQQLEGEVTTLANLDRSEAMIQQRALAAMNVSSLPGTGQP